MFVLNLLNSMFILISVYGTAGKNGLTHKVMATEIFLQMCVLFTDITQEI